MKSSEERRNDPQIRQTVEETLAAQGEAIENARKLIAEAESILAGVPYLRQASTIYLDALNNTRRAHAGLLRAQQYHYTSDTYVGNEAAGVLGAAIEADEN